MLKLILKNRCKLCSAITGNIQILPQNVRYNGFLELNLDNMKLMYQVKYRMMCRQHSGFNRRETSDHIKAVKDMLEKYDISTRDLKYHSNIFKELPWVIEQRIMLLEELGATKITVTKIENFFAKMYYLSVSLCKANFEIKSDVNLAKNIFSWVDDNSIFTRESLIKLDESIPMRLYYNQCFVEYLQSELDLKENQLKRISVKKKTRVVYNSFRLLNRILKILRDDLQFTTDFIIKNAWLLYQHPEHLKAVINTIKNNLPEVSDKIFFKCPKVLLNDVNDLEFKLSYLKQYKITPKIIGNCPRILAVNSNDLKTRMEFFSKNPFTLVFLRHPSFPVLLIRYHKVLVRIRYLESKNLKCATVYSLSSNTNFVENLMTKRKMNKTYLKSFCESLFEDDAEELLKRIEEHPYRLYIPLVQMYETLIYLKETFSTEVIYKHIYVILYNKMHLEVVRDALIKDPVYSKLPPDQFLAMCVYKIEENYNFSGEGVLDQEMLPNESAKEDFDQDGQIKETSKEYVLYADKS